jgi:hypothetical protein
MEQVVTTELIEAHHHRSDRASSDQPELVRRNNLGVALTVVFVDNPIQYNMPTPCHLLRERLPHFNPCFHKIRLAPMFPLESQPSITQRCIDGGLRLVRHLIDVRLEVRNPFFLRQKCLSVNLICSRQHVTIAIVYAVEVILLIWLLLNLCLLYDIDHGGSSAVKLSPLHTTTSYLLIFW